MPIFDNTHDVLCHIFTQPNPENGSPPPDHMAWVVFANGTLFYASPTDELPVGSSLDQIEQAGLGALRDLGPVAGGSPSADFTVSYLDQWFPDQIIYLVTYDNPAIATVVFADEVDELSAGLTGRTKRMTDLEELTVVAVRGFDGVER